MLINDLIWIVSFSILAGINLFSILLNYRIKNQFKKIVILIMILLFIPLELIIKGQYNEYYFFLKAIIYLSIFYLIINTLQNISLKRVFFEILLWLALIFTAVLIVYIYNIRLINEASYISVNLIWLMAVIFYVIFYLIDFFRRKTVKIRIAHKLLLVFLLTVMLLLFVENIILKSYDLILRSYDYFSDVSAAINKITVNVNYFIVAVLILVYMFIEEYEKVNFAIERNIKREKDSDILTIIQDLTVNSNEISSTVENILNISNFLIKPDGAVFYLFNTKDDQYVPASMTGYVIPPFFTNDKIILDNAKLNDVIYKTNLNSSNCIISKILTDNEIFYLKTDYHDANRLALKPLRDYANKLGSLLVGRFKVGEETGGLIYLFNRITDFSSVDYNIFNTLCGVTGVLISNIYSKQIARDNERLENEMKIAEQIQTSILPKHFSIPGYVICPYMKPAEEVGGDYYDVIDSDNGSFWINIGDVTGHGLTAGLLMMMLQTSASANIKYDPGIKPDKLIINSNKTIFDNIKNRLLLDQYITATFVRGDNKGNFEFAGAHEEILIYRNKSRKIERISTTGMWLGLTEDIGGLTKSGKFALNKNDFFILFTDGVIEIMNEKLEQYDMDRFISVLERFGDREPDELKDIIINDIGNFKFQQKDDITFIIVKRI